MKIALPNQLEMQSCISPYIVSRFHKKSTAWKRNAAKLLKKWTLIFLISLVKKVYQKSQKSVTNVATDYTNIWLNEQYPGSSDVEMRTHFLSWGDDIYEVRGWGEKRIHLLCLSKLIQDLKPKKYLEVGCGNGAMLMMISLMHPEVDFYGLELSDGGYSEALKMQNLDQIPDGMLKFLPNKPRDLDAYKRIKFTQGNAADLPFKDKEFDMIVTSLALEQMHEVQFKVLEQISRVCDGFVVMIEPFADFNKTLLRWLFTRSRDYFSCSTKNLREFKINPILIFGNLPSKVTRGVGIVVARIH